MQRKPLNASVYWRSDTRLPEEIFTTGFLPTNPSKRPHWWKECIRVEDSTSEVDASPRLCVSASFNFTSAAIFPMTSSPDGEVLSVTYLYAIALPAACKLDANRDVVQGADMALANYADMPIDLHSYQTEETCRILAKLYHGDQEAIFANALGTTLYAFEVMLASVPVQNIIGAVKIIRSEQFNQRLDIDSTYRHPFREFKIDSKVYKNLQFKPLQRLSVFSSNQSISEVDIDYSDEQVQTLKFLIQAPRKSTWTTFKAKDGLMGKTLATPDGTKKPAFKTSASSLFKIAISDIRIKPTEQRNAEDKLALEEASDKKLEW